MDGQAGDAVRRGGVRGQPVLFCVRAGHVSEPLPDSGGDLLCARAGRDAARAGKRAAAPSAAAGGLRAVGAFRRADAARHESRRAGGRGARCGHDGSGGLPDGKRVHARIRHVLECARDAGADAGDAHVYGRRAGGDGGGRGIERIARPDPLARTGGVFQAGYLQGAHVPAADPRGGDAARAVAGDDGRAEAARERHVRDLRLCLVHAALRRHAAGQDEAGKRGV